METLRDLVEEAKRRTILVGICVISVAYLMSLTSNSLWINIPVAILLVALMRRLSSEIGVHWRDGDHEKPVHLKHLRRSQFFPIDHFLTASSDVANSRWSGSFDSSAVETAVDELTKCVVDEWVTNLWYSAITSDQQAPKELHILIKGVIAEVVQRAKHVNLITLLSRDTVDLLGSHLDLYRRMQARIGPDILGTLSADERDEKLKDALVVGGELHPALISLDAEYKPPWVFESATGWLSLNDSFGQVLQRLTGGMVALVLRPQDAQCGVLRTLARELLACAVLRPVLNFANPGFLNEQIENLAVASAKGKTEREFQGPPSDPVNASTKPAHILERPIPRKPSFSGLEMIDLHAPKPTQEGSEMLMSSKKSVEKLFASAGDLESFSKMQQTATTGGVSNLKYTREVQSARGIAQMGIESPGEMETVPHADWATVLEAVTQKKTEVLAPEHLDNLWTKGRRYKEKELSKAALIGITVQQAVEPPERPVQLVNPEAEVTDTQEEVAKGNELVVIPDVICSPLKEVTGRDVSREKEDIRRIIDRHGELFEATGELEEDLPGIGFLRVGVRETTSIISHPLANLDDLKDVKSKNPSPDSGGGYPSKNVEGLEALNVNISKTTLLDVNAVQHLGEQNQERPQRAVRVLSRRRSRSSGGEPEGWKEPEGATHHQTGLVTLLKSGEGPSTAQPPPTSQGRLGNRSQSQTSMGAEAGNLTSTLTSHPSISKLHCRVLGAHFEKGGSKTFAVYSIRVTDSDHGSWRVQRRFRNFEQLHRRLKDMPYYNLTLPPKRFLSSNLDSEFIRDRCILLNKFLKDILAIPSVAELHEVWDFLSVNSKHYAFGESPSILQTLSVNMDDAVDDIFRQFRGVSGDIQGALKTATTGIRHRVSGSSASVTWDAPAAGLLGTTVVTPAEAVGFTEASQPVSLLDSGFGERAVVNEVWDEDETLANSARFGSVEWQSDSEVLVDSSLENQALVPPMHTFGPGNLDIRENQDLDGRFERALSEGHSPLGSVLGSDLVDELGASREWSPPKVCDPLLNLMENIFQLQGRGWIRRQVFWMAKQVLQLGMGDALDDWLLGKIRWLRREEVVALGFQLLRAALWPDGVFITRHPTRGQSSPVNPGLTQGMVLERRRKEGEQRGKLAPLTFEQRREAARRAMVVRGIIFDQAPAALVSLIGWDQYQRCATDIYYFLQSTVCLKQLAYSLLEMLLLAVFPELHDLILDVRSSAP